MTHHVQLARIGGVVFAVGGACTLVGSGMHPTGTSANYHTSIAEQLANPNGMPADWLTLFGSLLLAWALWMLMDSALVLNLGSPRLAPVVIRVIGAVGMVALGLAGPGGIPGMTCRHYFSAPATIPLMKNF